MLKLLIAAFLVFAYVSLAHAHSGGTDSEGCHRQTSTDTVHCHNGDRDRRDSSKTAVGLLSALAILYFLLKLDRRNQRVPFMESLVETMKKEEGLSIQLGELGTFKEFKPSLIWKFKF